MFGSGVGWYTDALTGQSLPYLIASGLPTYSREYKSSASASQPPPGPHRGGDGNGARTSGSAPASMATISGTKRPVPETSGSAEVLPDSSEESHPNGCDNLSLLSLVASGSDGQRRVGLAHPPELISEPPSTDGGLDGDQSTQVGSPLSGSATGRVESCDSDGVARSQHINSRSLVPFTDLSQLSPAGLARHLAGVAIDDDPPPSVSPRLGLVLQHFGVSKRDCSGIYPDTLAKASCCLDTTCFGRKTIKVVHASIVKWNVIASAMALALNTSRKALFESQCSHKDTCLEIQREPSASLGWPRYTMPLSPACG